MVREALVPITRDVLRLFYAKNPLEPVPRDAADHHIAAASALASLLGKAGTKVAQAVSLETPKR